MAAILWLLGSNGRSGGSGPGRRRALVFALASTFLVRADACWAGTCTIVGDCAQSGNYPYNYNNDEDCYFYATDTVSYRIERFDTEAGYDVLSIGTQYGYERNSGNSGLAGTTGSARPYGNYGNEGVFEWTSGYSGTRSGWQICATSCGGNYGNDDNGSATDGHNGNAADDEPSGERSKGLQATMYVLTGMLGLFGLTLLVLLVVSRFTEKAKPQPTRAGTPNVDGAAGWGPFGFLFPKSWVFIWWGYLGMLLFSGVILAKIIDALPSMDFGSGGMQQSETLETILSAGPFIHCILMPFLWTHKHREIKKRIENQGGAEVVVTSELDPEAKTVIFSMKLGCGQSCTVLLADLTMGLVEFVLWAVKRGSLGTINLSAFWFPSPFYTFWKAKMHIGLIQIDGAKICTTANQGDAYMKFCTEAMLNFWTLGIYGMCCGKRTSYGRWLDRHVLWQGAPPRGYTNRELAPLKLPYPPPRAPLPRPTPTCCAHPHACTLSEFRIFDEKLTCCQQVKVYLFGLLLFILGGFLSIIPYAAPAQTTEWTSRLCCSRLPPHSVAGSSVGSGRSDWCFLGTCTPSS